MSFCGVGGLVGEGLIDADGGVESAVLPATGTDVEAGMARENRSLAKIQTHKGTTTATATKSNGFVIVDFCGAAVGLSTRLRNSWRTCVRYCSSAKRCCSSSRIRFFCSSESSIVPLPRNVSNRVAGLFDANRVAITNGVICHVHVKWTSKEEPGIVGIVGVVT